MFAKKLSKFHVVVQDAKKGNTVVDTYVSGSSPSFNLPSRLKTYHVHITSSFNDKYNQYDPNHVNTAYYAKFYIEY